MLLKAAGRLSKQPDMLQREEVLQKAPRLQSTSKERALQRCSNKGSSNARDVFVLSHTRSGAVRRLLSGLLPQEPTSAASPTPAATAQEPRGDKGVPVGPRASWRAGSDNKAHREHLDSAGRINSCQNTHPCPPRDLHPGSEPAVSTTADQRPQNATKPRDFLHARTCPWGMCHRCGQADVPAPEEAVAAQTHFPSGRCPPSRCREPPRVAGTSLVCGTGCEPGRHRCHQRLELQGDAVRPSPSGT